MSQIQNRKRSHIDICTHRDVAFRKSTLLEEVELIHQALPELDLDQIDLRTSVASIPLAAPFVIGAMTGGTGDGPAFNLALAGAAARFGIAFCLGSIRPALLEESLLPEFEVKKHFPNAITFANIGANQLAAFELQQILSVSIRIADGLVVHLNAGMELIQPNGDTRFKGQIDAIARLVEMAGDFPIIVKQTGMGLSYKDGVLLRQAGVRTVESAGAGGTSWIGVETERAEGMNKKLGQMLWDFGIPSAVSIAWMHQLGLEVIGSGGIYSALDAARAIRLGACAVAMARPYLLAYQQNGETGVHQLVEELITGLKYVMLCVGTAQITDLKVTDCLIGDRLQKFVDLTKEKNR